MHSSLVFGGTSNKVSFSHRLLLWTSGKPWSQQELSGARSFMVCKTLLLFEHRPNYSSGSCVFLVSASPLGLGGSKTICCAPPTNAEVVWAGFILKQKICQGDREDKGSSSWSPVHPV